MSFRTAEPALKDVLDGIASGQIQLPDFQRGWVWDDDHIRSLIASLSLSYPIGAVMLLEAGNIPFKPRLFSGVDVIPAPTPKTLVLDGQQRLTSMYLALRSGKPVPTRTHKNVDTLRVYFLDMKKCLDPNVDREEAIISVPVNLKITQGLTKKLILDVSTPDLQYSQYLFPASLILDTTGFMEWERGFSAHHQHAPGPMSLMQRFRHEICMRFELFKIPAIELSQKTPREAVCQVFEKVNNKGVTLSVFELMTATFASSNINLRDDWDERRQRMTAKHEVLKSVDGTAFLTAVTLLASYQRHKKQGTPVSCKRSDVFDLTLKEFQKLAPEVEKGFIDAANLLAEQKIFDERTLPYPTQLVPLAALHAELGKKLQGQQTREKLLRWFWSGVMGELYGSASETRFAMDMQDVVAWLQGGNEPRTIRDADFSPTRLLSLQNRLAAAYKGLTALLMQQGSRDFVTGTPMDVNSYFNNAVDVHHIFPRAWCTKQNLPRDKWNSVVNKAPLASSTNRFIGGAAPSAYLDRIQKTKQVSVHSLGVFLSSHVIPMGALQSDNFDLFLRLRAAAILDLIEKAMGKLIVGRDSASTIKAFGGPLTLAAQPTNGQVPQNQPSPGKTRQSRISLADLDIHPGAELSFSRAPAIKAVVMPNNQIQYGGKTMSLSSAAVLVLRSMGKKSQVVSGSAYWMYEGESLGERRQRLAAARAKAMAAGAA